MTVLSKSSRNYNTIISELSQVHRQEKMIDLGKIVVGHGMDSESHHTLINIILKVNNQLTEKDH